MKNLKNKKLDSNSSVEFDVGKSVRFRNKDLIELLTSDCLDTANWLIKTKWENLNKMEKKQLKTKKVFLENKGLSTTLFISVYNAAYNEYFKRLNSIKKYTDNEYFKEMYRHLKVYKGFIKLNKKLMENKINEILNRK